MISLISALIIFGWIAYAARKRPAFLFVGIFLIWQFFLKIVAVVYIDVWGPIYSEEVATEVGGDGSSTPLMVFFVWLPLATLYFMLRSRRSVKHPFAEKRLSYKGITFAGVAIAVLALFAIALYVDMFARGDIPLFTGTERFDYKGGIFHEFFQNFIFLIAFIVGYIFARGRIVAGNWDLRCILLLIVFFVYLFLTGHRFGAFYVILSFFCLPLAALPFAKSQNWAIAPAQGKKSIAQMIVRSRVAIAAIAIVMFGVVAAAMINNLFFVRQYGDATGDALEQRLFVQPVHMYWLTWDRLREGQISGAGAALDFMFNDPLDAKRNTGIQYLMFLTLGAERSSSLVLDQNVDYAGGYPEIVIELGGVWIGAFIALVGSVITGFLYRTCILSVCRGHFLSALLSIYVCYGFLSFYLGGMINFLAAWTYWLKVGCLIAVLIVERMLDKREIRLFPWMMIPISKSGTTHEGAGA